ncbi:MAG: AI-2E family transporter [Mariniblastus sp.]|nr:AI-2E family transporter [Mariniblastus sp.]
MAKYFSFVLLLAVIVLLGLLFFRVMVGFLIPMFLAAILVVIFGPFHHWILKKVGGRKKIAAMTTTILIILVVLLPFGVMFGLAAAEARQVVRDFSASQVLNELSKIRKSIGLDFPSSPEFRAIEGDFMAMRSGSPYTDADRKSELDRQQVLLGDIRQNAAKLSAKLSSGGNSSSPAQPLDATWQQFQQEFEQLSKLHQKTQFESDPAKMAQAYPQFHAKAGKTYHTFNDFKNRQLGGKLWTWLREQANPTNEQLVKESEPILAYARDQLFELGASTTAFLIRMMLGIAITVISLYFFLLDGPAMIESIKALSPIDDMHEDELIREFGQVSRAVVLATLLSALVQGILGGFGYYFAGLDSIFLLAMATSCLALVPFVGAASVWVPCCLYLYFVDHSLVAAVGLAVYGILAISFADNVIKPIVLHGQSNMHPLIALLSILGGIATMGPIGLLIGPMIVAFLQSLLKILRRELASMDQEESLESLPSTLQLTRNIPGDLRWKQQPAESPAYVLTGPPLDGIEPT